MEDIPRLPELCHLVAEMNTKYMLSMAVIYDAEIPILLLDTRQYENHSLRLIQNQNMLYFPTTCKYWQPL